MLKYNLSQLGFDEFFTNKIDESQEYVLARVTEQHRDIYKIICEDGEHKAKVSGKFSYASSETRDYPVVGDWVMINKKDDFEDFAVISVPQTSRYAIDRIQTPSTWFSFAALKRSKRSFEVSLSDRLNIAMSGLIVSAVNCCACSTLDRSKMV